MKGPLNISAVTRQVTKMRGKASRRIVRGRVRNLVDHGVLREIPGRVHTYDLVERGDQ
jgi:hypothetical protein